MSRDGCLQENSMKYTFEGFGTQALMNLGLDIIDAVILRFVVDFRDSKRMKKHIKNDKEYFWIDYQHLLDELPPAIIGIHEKHAIRKRFIKYERRGLMEHVVYKRHLPFYRFTDLYEMLVSFKPENADRQEKLIGVELQSSTLEFKSSRGLNPKVQPLEPESSTMNSSSNSSIIHSSNNNNGSDQCEQPKQEKQEKDVVVVVPSITETLPHDDRRSYLGIETKPSELKTGKNGGKVLARVDEDTLTETLSDLSMTYSIPYITLEKFMYDQQIPATDQGLKDLTDGLTYAKQHKRSAASLLGFAKCLFFKGKYAPPEQKQAYEPPPQPKSEPFYYKQYPGLRPSSQPTNLGQLS
jgi:hypothetical protein